MGEPPLNLLGQDDSIGPWRAIGEEGSVHLDDTHGGALQLRMEEWKSLVAGPLYM